MGGGSYRTEDWDEFSKPRTRSDGTSRGALHDASTRTADIYAKGAIDKDLDPHGFVVREACDGPDHPKSTPIVIALDVTGSMSAVLDSLARKGLKTVCEEVYKRKPVTDPQICTCAIGDVEAGDRAPFQATQFESDIRIFDQLEKLYLERGGGGNQHESYILAWYFAAFRTKTDSFSKRGEKGFLFTVGDEEVTPSLPGDLIERAMGRAGEAPIKGYSAQELYEAVYGAWNVFHIIIREGSDGKRPEVLKSWQEVLGPQKVISLADHTKLGETVVSVLEILAGKTLKNVTDSWDGSTAVVIGDALKNVTAPAAQSLDAAVT